MELIDKGIHIHARQVLVLSNVQTWPAPRRHQHYLVECDLKQSKKNVVSEEYLSALQVVRQRPDINALQISLCDLLEMTGTMRDALKTLLSIKDRSWSVLLLSCLASPESCTTLDDDTLPIVRRRAFSVLENIQYLSVITDSCNNMLYQDFLGALPKFHQLKCLDFQGWEVNPQDVEVLYNQYPSLALRVRGITLQTQKFQTLSHPVFSKETVARIHALDLWFANFSVSEVSILVSTVMTLPSLHTLRWTLPDESERHMESILSLMEWLTDPLCPVTDLTFRHNQSDVLPLFLMDLPNIPNLQTIRLDVRDLSLDMDRLLDALLEASLVESIILRVYHLDAFTYDQLFRFLLESRPRLFTVKLTTAYQLREGSGPEKIHHVSLVHQSLQNFYRSRKEHNSAASFPLSAWSFVLEKLGSAYESSCNKVHTVGIDARYSVIRELFGMSHSLVAVR